MESAPRRVGRSSIVVATAALALAACGSDDAVTSEGPATSQASAQSEPSGTATEATDGDAVGASTRTIVDRSGTIEVPTSAERVVVTDNRVVRLVEAWDIDIVAAPLDVFPTDISYASDDSVANLGNHGEPDLEALIASDPDLVLTGYRFSEFYDEITDLVPDAAVVNTDTDYESADPVEELRWLTTLTGGAVGHDDDAAALIAELDASIERAAAAYDSEETVMGLLTSGGDISYVAPVTGRSIGPIFPVLGFVAALDQEAEDVSHGDDISVEAIAAANPDWLIVLDRDAAVVADGDEFSSADELLAESEALANVTAIIEGNIVYLPSDFYLTEDILAYTELFTSIADAMEAAN